MHEMNKDNEIKSNDKPFADFALRTELSNFSSYLTLSIIKLSSFSLFMHNTLAKIQFD